MRVLSFDVGIKNLAMCLLDIAEPAGPQQKPAAITILEWKLLDLSNRNIYLCSAPKKQPTKKGGGGGNRQRTVSGCSTGSAQSDQDDQSLGHEHTAICGAHATYTDKNNNYYCKRHAKSCELMIPKNEHNINQLKRNKLADLKEIVAYYGIPLDETVSHTKNYIIGRIQAFQREKMLEPVVVQSGGTDLISICRVMTTKLNQHFDYLGRTPSGDGNGNIDVVLIENQIGKIAVRMKSIQGMLTQYFVQKNVPVIEYVSSMNKLKHFCDKGQKLTYNERKKEAIKVTGKLLEDLGQSARWGAYFANNSKKDDLADAFLQGYWYGGAPSLS